MDRVKRIWYLSPMRAAKVQASLRIRAVSPEPSLLAYTSNESRGTVRQKARSQAPLNGWACAVKICHDGMLEDINSLDGAQIIYLQIIFFKPVYSSLFISNVSPSQPCWKQNVKAYLLATYSSLIFLLKRNSLSLSLSLCDCLDGTFWPQFMFHQCFLL